MRLTESLVLYGLVGLSCGVYQAKIRQDGSLIRGVLLLMSIPFWPLLLPLLFPHSQRREREITAPTPTPKRPGPHQHKIRSGVAEIEAEIARAEGAAGRLLSQEVVMLRAIEEQLYWLDGKLDEIQELLGSPTFSLAVIDGELANAKTEALGDLALESIKIKRQNALQMQAYQTQYTSSLEDSLAMLSRIHSQITLLRFTGAEGPELAAGLEQLLTLLDGLGEASAL